MQLRTLEELPCYKHAPKSVTLVWRKIRFYIKYLSDFKRHSSERLRGDLTGGALKQNLINVYTFLKYYVTFLKKYFVLCFSAKKDFFIENTFDDYWGGKNHK